MPTLNGTGACCASGVVNKCGVCDGPAEAVLDIHGACCSAGVLDEMGKCCEHSNGLDSCGVCGGADTCVVVMELTTTNSTNGTTSSAQLAAVSSAVASALDVPEDWVSVSENTAPARRLTTLPSRRLADTGVIDASVALPVTR